MVIFNLFCLFGHDVPLEHFERQKDGNYLIFCCPKCGKEDYRMPVYDGWILPNGEIKNDYDGVIAKKNTKEWS